jgi:FtsP/CotA-like multicopper oxidase with cupredoxin domain
VGDALPILPEESGWMDTVNVQPNSMVTIAGQFASATGKVVYHCHSLDHEDEGMMRPIVVMPTPINEIHMLLMAMMNRDT